MKRQEQKLNFREGKEQKLNFSGLEVLLLTIPFVNSQVLFCRQSSRIYQDGPAAQVGEFKHIFA